MYSATANTNAGYTFDSWEITCGGQSVTPTFVIDGDVEIIANYSPNANNLNLSVAESGGGSIGECGAGDFQVANNSNITVEANNNLKFYALDGSSYVEKIAVPVNDPDYSFDK